MFKVYLINPAVKSQLPPITYRQLVLISLYNKAANLGIQPYPSHSSVAQYLKVGRPYIYKDFNYINQNNLKLSPEITIQSKIKDVDVYFRFYMFEELSFEESLCLSFWASRYARNVNSINLAAACLHMSPSAVSAYTLALKKSERINPDRTPTKRTIELIKEMKENGHLPIKPANKNAGTVSDICRERALKRWANAKGLVAGGEQ